MVWRLRGLNEMTLNRVLVFLGIIISIGSVAYLYLAGKLFGIELIIIATSATVFWTIYFLVLKFNEKRKNGMS